MYTDTDTDTDTDVDTESDTEAQPEVNEGALDSTGISDNSSDADPESLSVADDYAGDIDIEIETESEEETTEEITEETTEVATETSVEQTATDTTEEITEEVEEETIKKAEEATEEAITNATFETVLTQEKAIIDENSAATRVASVALDNPSGIDYTVQITGAGSNSFIYDKDSNELRYNGSADYESQSRYELVLVFTKDNNNEVINMPINIDVNDIDEAPSLTTTLAAANFTESSAVGTTIMTASAPDPEGGTITYSLSGTDAAKFTIDADGTVKIASLLDYETKDNYSITVNASDGTHSLSTAIAVSLTSV